MTVVVRLRGAQFGYDGRAAAVADLDIVAGEVVAVLGPNGSGKSTLVKGMLGLVDRYGGTCEWFGRPLDQLGDRWRIGYVPQRQLAATPIPVTLAELVHSGRVARSGLWRHHRADDRRSVAEAIDAVGLGGHESERVDHLSGGQQRRALVARALAGGPDVLVLDEPLAGVDHESQEALAAIVAALTAEGATAIVVLHELGPFEPIVTRAVCMDNGAVAFDGPPREAPAALLAHAHDHDPHGGDVEPPATLGLLPR